MLNDIQKSLLYNITGLDSAPEGAYNIRLNGECESRKVSDNVQIISKTDKPGIDIIIKAGTKNETITIPVIISKTGFSDTVYNDFFVGEGADVTIVAGCSIHNCGDETSRHDGIHTFYVGKNARLKYVENHYGEREEGKVGDRIMNPTTVIHIDEGGFMEMETTQIRGIDSTDRKTVADLKDNANLVVKEKLLTHQKQVALTDFVVDLNGENSGADLISRSVATDESYQKFVSNIRGNNACSGHTECDAIIMDKAKVDAVPQLCANHIDASLIHEAAIGKIAGEQLVKLMTLGLTEEQAEEQIVSGFLK